jgi:hypothetical protein
MCQPERGDSLSDAPNRDSSPDDPHLLVAHVAAETPPKSLSADTPLHPGLSHPID